MRLRDSGQVYSSYRQRKQKYRNTDGSGATTVDKVEEKKAAAVAAAAAAARGDADEEGERSSKKARVQTKQEPGAPGEAPAKQLSKNYKGDKEPGWRPFNEVQVGTGQYCSRTLDRSWGACRTCLGSSGLIVAMHWRALDLLPLYCLPISFTNSTHSINTSLPKSGNCRVTKAG